jgi:hypothetical protein
MRPIAPSPGYCSITDSSSARSFRNVAAQTPNEADIVGRVDKNLDIHLFEKTRLGENQNAFDNNYRFGFNQPGFMQTRVSFEIVKPVTQSASPALSLRT